MLKPKITGSIAARTYEGIFESISIQIFDRAPARVLKSDGGVAGIISEGIM